MAIFKPETGLKIKLRAKRFWNETKELLPWMAGGIAGGMLIGGYVGAIQNQQEIRKTNRRLDMVENTVNENAICSSRDQGRIEALERQSNLLMEKALRITEGKESA